MVGMFVEFFGDGVDTLTLADRATIANMAPEYGGIVVIFSHYGFLPRWLTIDRSLSGIIGINFKKKLFLFHVYKIAVTHNLHLS